MPHFDDPPVIETRLGVQFAPLIGFQTAHFGLLWKECVGVDGWRLTPDLPALPTDTEQFGDKQLRPRIETEGDFPQVRMRLQHEDGVRSVQFQPNKLFFFWDRRKGPGPGHQAAREEFSSILNRVARFTEAHGLPPLKPNLWEVTYTNVIPQGTLWETPADWHKVLPSLFVPGGPAPSGYPWATFSGDWLFEIPDRRGRVKVRAQKSVANPGKGIVLLLIVTARGEIGGTGVSDWPSGLVLGHKSAVSVFCDLTSSEAKKLWRHRS
jgi:uncharacterized protein (TIGR04255 family)